MSSIHSPENFYEAVGEEPDIRPARIRIARKLHKWTSKTGRIHLIAVSGHTKRTVCEAYGLPPDKISLLYNPIDVSDASNAPYGEVMNGLGSLEGGPFLVSVGRLSPEKGIIHLIEAMPAVLREFPQVRLISVGCHADASYSERVHRRIDELGISASILFAGESSNVRSYLRACDVFVFPSLSEGLGIALAEAMYEGCASVASDLEAIREFVDHGKNGILVTPANSDQIAGAVCDLLRDEPKRLRIRDAAKETAMTKFQPVPAAEKLTEIYRMVADRRSTL